MDSGETEVVAELRVRSPSVATRDDFSVRVQRSGRIADVKAAIERAHEAAPPARDMRIIWKGRILDDDARVACIYEDARAAAADIQTLHFVLSTLPPSVQQGAKSIAGSSSTSNSTSNSHVSDAHAWGRPEAPPAARPPPVVTPLGSRFQYVLVDGVPHLVEWPEVDPQQHHHQAEPADRPRSSSSSSSSGRVRAFEEAYARVVARCEAIEQRLEQARARAPEAPAPAPAAAPAPQPAAMLRGAVLGAVWSFGWLMLRVAMAVLLLAHDASLERIFVLTFVIAAVAVARSAWARRQIRLFDRQPQPQPQPRHQHEEEEEQHQEQQQQQPLREYTALEKACALAVALVTSLVPSEPFHLPDADE